MAKRESSELRELLILLRRIVVLGVAAYGLWREMPYLSLLIRVAVLWGVLYLSGEIVEVVFRYLSNHAKSVVIRSSPHVGETKIIAVEKPGLSPSR
jgi:hypothetical protein